MTKLYIVLAAAHIVSMVVTGILWTIIDLNRQSPLRANLRDIRAVHFGSLWLTPWFLGLGWAFQTLQVPAWHQIFFPAGLGLLVLFSGIGWMFPRPPGVDSFYYWTVGPAKWLSLFGLACLIFCLFWTAAVLTLYAWPLF